MILFTVSRISRSPRKDDSFQFRSRADKPVSCYTKHMRFSSRYKATFRENLIIFKREIRRRIVKKREGTIDLVESAIVLHLAILFRNSKSARRCARSINDRLIPCAFVIRRSSKAAIAFLLIRFPVDFSIT